MDFTLKKYQELLSSLKEAGYHFQIFTEYLDNPEKRSIVLRQDVEKYYPNALIMAKIQHDMNIKATYYFRFSHKHFEKDIVGKIASLGHEVGYHYDDLAKCRGNFQKAIERFETNLEKLRQIAAVTSICMDGSPLSKYDNRSLWEKYDYRSLGLIGEPYFDIDFSKVLYLTDTGRRWDGEKVSVRDKVRTEERRTKNEDRTKNNTVVIPSEDEGRNLKLKTQNSRHPAPGTWYPTFHSTNDIIKAAKAGNLPNQIMLTFHPQRWTDKPGPWVKELVWQNVKNLVKRLIVK